jgi:hypothetical protein
MEREEEFRKYYNHTIHPELMRMERRRLRLIRLLAASGILIAGILIFEFYLGLAALMLFLLIPIALYIAFLLYRIQQFRLTFKPNVMRLILDFIDDGVNFDPSTPLRYDAKGSIPKARFLASQIFKTNPAVYKGEDFITGKVREMNFEMCELVVEELSPVEPGLHTVFNGVFMHATFPENAVGRMIIWPRRYRTKLFGAIKEFTWQDGHNVDHEVANEEFRDTFMTYATRSTHVIGLLSEPMQDALVRYREIAQKEIFISFIDREIYAAVTEEKDLLEPHLFRSNLSYGLVKEFFQDINLLLQIAEDFDKTH